MEVTSTIYARLDAIPWFSQCGLALPANLPFNCVAVQNWNEAMASCGGELWDWVTMEARNMLTSYLDHSCRDEFQKWNALARDAKKVLEPGVWANIDDYVKSRNLKEYVAGAVRWDTLNAVMEVAYQDFNPPVFFLKLLEVYESGHFPCGWESEFPDGKLLVL